MLSSSSKKIGRNDPCNCGSGKKYKKCCLEQVQSRNVLDYSWKKLRRLEGEIIDDHLFPYVFENFPPSTMQRAADEFWLVEETDLSLERFEELFLPWFLFNWSYKESYRGKKREKYVIAQQYLQECDDQLSKDKQSFIEQMCQTYYSFYIVVDVIANQRLILRDILLQSEHVVKEQLATQTLCKGNIVYARILTFDDQSICIGIGPYSVPIHYYSELLELRKDLEQRGRKKLTPERLRNDYDELLRFIFLGSVSEQFAASNLCNTDGDPIEFCTLNYTHSLSPAAIFKKLHPLLLEQDPEECLREGVKDKAGNLIRIEFTWYKQGNKLHKHWNNTVMGQIVIEVDKVTVAVNSQARAKTVQNLLKRYLNKEVCYQNMVIESLEQKHKSYNPTVQQKEEMEAFNQLPEIQESLKVFFKEHWESWFDEAIPMLNYKTPRQAAKTKEGRERLEALFLHYEGMDQKSGNNAMKADIPFLRKELGLVG